jgi:hypothetical protein
LRKHLLYLEIFYPGQYIIDPATLALEGLIVKFTVLSMLPHFTQEAIQQFPLGMRHFIFGGQFLDKGKEYTLKVAQLRFAVSVLLNFL